MDKLMLPGNRGYLVAGIGGIVALFAFLALSYISIPAADSSAYSEVYNASSLGGLIWLEVLFALAAIVIPSLLVFRSNPFGLSTTPIATQIRWGIYGLIGAGALGFLGQVLVPVSGALNTNGIVVPLNTITGYTYSIGYWLYLLSAIAIIVGGVLALRAVMSPGSLSSQQSWMPPTQYPPYQQVPPPSLPDYVLQHQQQQPPQYPPYDPQQLQPTQQSQPPQQYPSYPQQWPPTQPPQPPSQYPPYQQQPWSPPQPPPPSPSSWPPQQQPPPQSPPPRQ